MFLVPTNQADATHIFHLIVLAEREAVTAIASGCALALSSRGTAWHTTGSTVWVSCTGKVLIWPVPVLMQRDLFPVFLVFVYFLYTNARLIALRHYR